MSAFTDQLQADLDSVFFNTDEFAQTVVYTPKATGVGTSIAALVDYGVQDNNGHGKKGDGYTWTVVCQRNLRSAFDHGRTRDVVTVEFKASDVPDPHYLDTIEIDGAVWTVTEVYDA
ncbi:head-tail joining protein [Desulfobacula phenolica]|uniref:Uncharacterized protein n=1 Tax=Desulfobacula phenolica TaxID=90732 RepID=A0A1H2I3H2_9BACT|nr:hypothetical protein [Desulfobacula phenolica]SDU38348.1 hypothetical protein SAMN04487931_107197 [Desulfobacula phenolica]